MSDPFDAFDSSASTATQQAPAAAASFDDPAAEFLASQDREMAKIENSESNNNQFADDGFGDFDGTSNASSKQQIKQESFSNGFGSSSDNFFGEMNGSSSANHIHTNGNGDSAHSIDDAKSAHQDWVVVDENKETEKKDVYSVIGHMDQLSVEPEKIKKWREDQKIRLETKDTEEEQKKKEWKDAAKKELDDWYRQRSEQLGKTHDNNKAVEADMVSSRESTGQPWDKLAKLCDFNPKANKNTKDVARMRSILLQLKQTPLQR